MSLLFQYPALIGLLALAGVPAVVHLLSRARPPVYRFSSIDFLRRVLRETARFRQPRDWMLLALRTLALLALAAAFASPFLVSKSAPPAGGKSTVILMVDRSASMAAREGAGSRFDNACAQAVRYLDESRPAQANLIWIDAVPDAVFPEPGPNTAYLTDQLKQAGPHPEPGALTAAFDLALRQLAAASGHRELVVISDFQATAWRDFAPRLPQDIVVRAQRVASAAPANLTVSSVIAQPAEPVSGQDLTVLARVRNFSAEPVRTEITLDADGARQSQALALTAWGDAECAFQLRPARPGPLPLSVSVTGDSFPADDARHAVIHVRDSLRMAVAAAPDSADTRIFGKLAAALPWLEIADNSADFRFIAAWTGDDVAALRDAALAGTTVLVRPAASCPLAAIRGLTAAPADPADGAILLETSAAGWQAIPQENHAANRLFRSGDFGNPFAGSFRERLRIPAAFASLPGVRAIASYADGVPALLECAGDGASIIIWNLTVDPAKTDWPVQGAFLPAIAEILLRVRTQASTGMAETPPGSPLTWTSADPGAVSLVGTSAEPLEITASTTADGTLWQSRLPAAPGIHRWQISGQTIACSAVNFPESESDLRPLDASPAFGKLDASGDALARQAALAHGLPLWPWLALAALLFLTSESLVHSRLFAT